MAKLAAKQIAYDLRSAGHSYNHIARIVRVSKSTLGLWLADVPYTPNAETIERIGRARAASNAAMALKKRESISKAKKEAISEIGELARRDLFMLGLGLYIGEGTKSSQSTRFVNANPFVLRFIIRWFVKALGISIRQMRMRLHIYPDSDDRHCIEYWSNFTNIPKEQFFKSVIDIRQNKKPRNTANYPTERLT
jgi:hypothetical protein